MTKKLTEPTLYHIVLLRHGESTGNAGGIQQGQSDWPLSETGVQQAQALAERWLRDGVHFDQAIASPLSRARQTAEIVTSALGVPLEFDPTWMERHNGRRAGLPAAEADQLYPRPAFLDPYTPIGQTGESQWDLYLRGGRAVANLLRRPPGRYLVVSHGGILNMALYAILGILPQANFQGTSFRFRNTAYATVTYVLGEHKWTLQGINDHAHWQFDDQKFQESW